MVFKKVTYTLPAEAVRQITNLSKRTGKSKSSIVAELIMKTETDYDKIVKKSVDLESTKDISLDEMIGAVKTDKEFDPVEVKKRIYRDRVRK
jgi:hypothetical protein